MQQVFKGENYSMEETINLLDFFSATSIQGRQLFKGGNYSRKYGNSFFMNGSSKINSYLMPAKCTVSYHAVVPGDSTCNQLQIKLIMI